MKQPLHMQQGKFEIPQFEQIPDTVHQSVLETLAALPERKQSTGMTKTLRFSRRVLLPFAAVLILVTGMSVLAVSLYEQRMKNINQEKLEEFYLQIQTVQVESFHYNRQMTEGERSRYDTLNREYEEEGKFPQGALTVLESPEAYTGKGVGFYVTRSTLFFPEREMNEEELLQLIDFYHQVNYSLQKVGEQIRQGTIEELRETSGSGKEIATTQQGEQDTTQFSTIAYEGNLSIQCIAAGANAIYLEGWDRIEKMEIGSSTSTPFFLEYEKAKGNTDLQPRISDMAESIDGDLYVAVILMDGNEAKAGQLWNLDREGNYIRTIDLGEVKPGKLAVDARGNLYVRPRSRQQDGTILYIYDRQGNWTANITSEHDFHETNGLCRGKDGNIYMLFEDFDGQHTCTGILRIDPEEKRAMVAAEHFLPDDGPAYDILTPGEENDFVILGMDGIYTYDLQSEKANLSLAAYDAPCAFEGCKATGLPDGRLLLAKSMEYTETMTAGKPQYRWKPDATYFYIIRNASAGAAASDRK